MWSVARTSREVVQSLGGAGRRPWSAPSAPGAGPLSCRPSRCAAASTRRHVARGCASSSVPSAAASDTLTPPPRASNCRRARGRRAWHEGSPSSSSSPALLGRPPGRSPLDGVHRAPAGSARPATGACLRVRCRPRDGHDRCGVEAGAARTGHAVIATEVGTAASAPYNRVLEASPSLAYGAGLEYPLGLCGPSRVQIAPPPLAGGILREREESALPPPGSSEPRGRTTLRPRPHYTDGAVALSGEPAVPSTPNPPHGRPNSRLRLRGLEKGARQVAMKAGSRAS